MSQGAPDPPATTSAQLVALRLVVVSSVLDVVLMAINAGDFLRTRAPWPFLGPMLFIMSHHAGSTLGPTLFPVKRWIDIALTLFEMGFSWFATASFSQNFSIKCESEDILLVVSHWTLSLCLTLLFALRVTALSKSTGKKWSITLDVTQAPQDCWWRYPVTAIFGQKLWRSAIPGEAGWVTILRGVGALVAVTAIVAFAAYEIIMSPFVETGIIRQREYQISIDDKSLTKLSKEAEWAVVVLPKRWEGDSDLDPNSVAKDSKAIAVGWSFDTETAIHDWPFLKALDIGAGTLCATDFATEVLGNYQTTSIWTVCGQKERKLPPLQVINIHVDFSKLFTPFDPERHSTGSLNFAARAFLVLRSTLDRQGGVFEVDSPPLHIFPGTHQLSTVEPTMQRRLKSPSLGFLGLEKHRSAVVFRSTQTMARQSINISDPNVATLAIAFDYSNDKVRVNEEFRDNSVVSGLSAVGGLGSFLSALFVVLLGTSLMKATTRMKDASPLGLLHTGMKDKLTQACKEKYPGLETDIERFRQNPGLIMYLFDTLVVMGPLEHLEEKLQEVAESSEPTTLKEDVEAIAL